MFFSKAITVPLFAFIFSFTAFTHRVHSKQTTQKCKLFRCKLFDSRLFTSAATQICKRILTTHSEEGKMDSSSSNEVLVLILLSQKKRRGFWVKPLLRRRDRQEESLQHVQSTFTDVSPSSR